jgi:hypothetical protein
MIAKLLTKWWWLIVGGLLTAMCVYGYNQMYFHQDDLDWFILANRPFGQMMAYPIADHINYLFRLLLFFEWNLFGFHFPPYLLTSLLIHACVIWLLHRLVRETTGRADLAAYAALLFSINTNWNEVILWTSGQTISITVLFVLWVLYFIWQQRNQWLMLALVCLTSALALGLPLAAWLTYGFMWSQRRVTRLGWGIILILVGVALIYRFFGGDGTRLSINPQWLWQVFLVWLLAPLHTVLGRLLIPFDLWESLRLVGVGLLLLFLGYRYHLALQAAWRDQWSRFLFLQLMFYYLIVAVGRAQYGVGIMRAERYAYLGLALGLLLFARIVRKVKFGKWIWLIPFLVLIQNVGFYRRAQVYVVRPQQLQALVTQIKMMDPTLIDQQAYLPYFVLQDKRLRYADLLPLLTH